MNLTAFIDDNIILRKTIRILVYPNITYSKDLRKDSYIQVITNMITELNKIRSDLFFYMVLPEYMECLDFPNVKQLYLKMPSYPPTMRSHFDVFKFQKLVGHDYDFDLVFSLIIVQLILGIVIGLIYMMLLHGLMQVSIRIS